MTRVVTALGALRGAAVAGAEKFLNIPYAEPPVGGGRFRLPRQARPWRGTRDARRFGPVAPQPVLASGRGTPPAMSEDCLTLNVYTPSADRKRRPVMVWIHGGGFMTGTAHWTPYDGGRLAAAGDVVVVAINYRLGFLGGTDLRALGGGDDVGEALWMHDQVEALRWVRSNIAEFGGDPENVTVFGESAGGIAASMLAISPLSRGLVHKAICQSGASSVLMPREVSERRTDALLRLTGATTLPELRRLPVARILEAQAQYYAAELRRTTELAFAPGYGGAAMPDTATRLIRGGAGRDVPVMVGVTEHEWRLWMLWEHRPGLAAVESAFRRLLPGCDALGAYREAYPGEPLADLYYALKSDYFFRVPALLFAEAHAARQPSTYRYEFGWRSRLREPELRAAHSMEIDFVFGHVDSDHAPALLGPGDPPVGLSRRMQAAWTSFASRGDPNHEGLGDWPAYAAGSGNVMYFNEESRVHDSLPASIVELYRRHAYRRGGGGMEI